MGAPGDVDKKEVIALSELIAMAVDSFGDPIKGTVMNVAVNALCANIAALLVSKVKKEDWGTATEMVEHQILKNMVAFKKKLDEQRIQKELKIPG